MAYYEVKAIIEKGEKVHQLLPLKIQPQISYNNVLVGILDNGVWAIATDLTDKREYDSFYDSYAKGNWLMMHLFNVSENEIDNCSGGGRISSECLEELLAKKGKESSD